MLQFLQSLHCITVIMTRCKTGSIVAIGSRLRFIFHYRTPMWKKKMIWCTKVGSECLHRIMQHQTDLQMRSTDRHTTWKIYLFIFDGKNTKCMRTCVSDAWDAAGGGTKVWIKRSSRATQSITGSVFTIQGSGNGSLCFEILFPA